MDLRHGAFAGACVALIAAGLAAAENDEFRPRPFDWPQWRGLHRDCVSAETDLLQEWPQGGPPVVWKASNLGVGHASLAVAAGRIFTLGSRTDGLFVLALSEKNGQELWARRLGNPWPAEGTDSTPTVDGNWLYAILPAGELVCLDAGTGQERWRRNLVQDFGARFPGRGMSESALVDGDRVICTPGGENATLVALDKATGKTLWQARVPERDQAAYASPIVGDVGGRRQYIQFVQGGVVGVAAEDGTFLWRYDRPSNTYANCSTPLFADGHVFAASAYSRGGGLVRLRTRGTGIDAEEVYFSKNMKNHHGGMVVVDGYLYGANGGNEDVPRLVCLEFRTGKLMWEERRAGKGSLAYADGRLYYRTEDGTVLLVDAGSRGFVERGRFRQPERQGVPAWAYPVIANGKLYLRDQKMLFCYDVKKH
jgi:outer membrane protein assembly factor BamB